MGFESILSAYKTKTCIMPVENYGDGGYGNIRICAGFTLWRILSAE